MNKKIMLLTTMLVLFYTSFVHADWQLSVKGVKILNNNPEIQTDVGFRVVADFGNDDIKLGIGVGKHPYLHAGQHFDFTPIFARLKLDFTKNLSASIGVAHFIANYDEGGWGNEAIYYLQKRYWRGEIPIALYPRYTATIKDNWGLIAGIDFNKRITYNNKYLNAIYINNIDIRIGCGMVKHETEVFYVAWNATDQPAVYLNQELDFGGWEVTAGFTIYWESKWF